MTRSVSRQQGGLGQPDGFVSVLATRENIGMVIVDPSPPHMPTPELPSRPVGECVTPDPYGQACMDELADVYVHFMGVAVGGLHRAGTFGAVVGERGGGT